MTLFFVLNGKVAILVGTKWNSSDALVRLLEEQHAPYIQDQSKVTYRSFNLYPRPCASVCPDDTLESDWRHTGDTLESLRYKEVENNGGVALVLDEFSHRWQTCGDDEQQHHQQQ